MRKRFWKSENNRNCKLHAAKRLAVLFSATSLLAFSAVSCGLMQMREIDDESKLGIGGGTRVEVAPLKQAEQQNEVKTQEELLGTTAPETFQPAEEEIDHTVSLVLAGGVSIDTSICADALARAVQGKDYSFLTMYSDVYPTIQNAEMALVTLNAPVDDAYSIASSEYKNMPVESVVALAELGFDVINIAGHNRMDGGSAGILDTIHAVGDTGVIHIGAHTDAIDAGEVRILSKDGIEIAFVAFSESKTENTDGIILHDLQDTAAAASILSYADLISDVVVVTVTWENSYDQYVQTSQKESVKMLAEAGADIIIGNNGVCLQTAEWLEREDGTRAFAAYSLGNLLSSGKTAETVVGGLLTLDITAEADGTILLENISIQPVVSHYAAGQTGYQVVKLMEYEQEIASTHGIQGLTVDAMLAGVKDVIPSDFLINNGNT